MADPEFPIGGGAESLGGRRQPLTWVLLGKNTCENERIGSRRGGRRRPPGSANDGADLKFGHNKNILELQRREMS